MVKFFTFHNELASTWFIFPSTYIEVQHATKTSEKWAQAHKQALCIVMTLTCRYYLPCESGWADPCKRQHRTTGQLGWSQRTLKPVWWCSLASATSPQLKTFKHVPHETHPPSAQPHKQTEKNVPNSVESSKPQKEEVKFQKHTALTKALSASLEWVRSQGFQSSVAASMHTKTSPKQAQSAPL